MTERERDARVKRFIERLAELGTGERAMLKRDVGKSLSEAQSLGLFYRILPRGIHEAQEEIFFLAATLYPLLAGGSRGNFGASLRRARDENNRQGLDRRMEALLDADMTQLQGRLRYAVRYAQSKGVCTDWQELLTDLLYWNHPERHVQKRWARAYFGASNKETGVARPVSPILKGK